MGRRAIFSYLTVWISQTLNGRKTFLEDGADGLRRSIANVLQDGCAYSNHLVGERFIRDGLQLWYLTPSLLADMPTLSTFVGLCAVARIVLAAPAASGTFNVLAFNVAGLPAFLNDNGVPGDKTTNTQYIGQVSIPF